MERVKCIAGWLVAGLLFPVVALVFVLITFVVMGFEFIDKHDEESFIYSTKDKLLTMIERIFR